MTTATEEDVFAGEDGGPVSPGEAAAAAEEHSVKAEPEPDPVAEAPVAPTTRPYHVLKINEDDIPHVFDLMGIYVAETDIAAIEAAADETDIERRGGKWVAVADRFWNIRTVEVYTPEPVTQTRVK